MGPLKFLLILIAAAAAAHVATVFALPRIAMARAMDGVEAAAGGPNRIFFPPPVTPDSPTIVRPAPDLLYSICVYDLSGGPVRVHAPSPGRQTLTVYAANSDALLHGAPGLGYEGLELLLTDQPRRRDDILPIAHRGVTIFHPSSQRGIVLIRRIAPDAAAIAEADAARRGDVCEPAGAER